MNDDMILNQASAIFASDRWWKPILGYIFTNCGKFTNKKFTHEEYSCFCSFKTLLIDLFDSLVCHQINVRPNQLEASIYNSASIGNKKALVITSFLSELTDFEKFREKMIKTSSEVDEFVTNQILNLHAEQMSTGVTDDDNNNADVAKLLEKGEETVLSEATSKKCQEMKIALQVSEHPHIVTKPIAVRTRASYGTSPVIHSPVSPVTPGRPGATGRPTILRPHLGK